jgi:hypothetical protein
MYKHITGFVKPCTQQHFVNNIITDSKQLPANKNRKQCIDGFTNIGKGPHHPTHFPEAALEAAC